MRDLSQLKRRAAIEAQIESAPQARSTAPSGFAAWLPAATYICAAAAIIAGVVITYGSNSQIDPSTTGAIDRESALPLRDAPIIHASPTMDLEEARNRLCVTGEVCVDEAPAAERPNAAAEARDAR